MHPTFVQAHNVCALRVLCGKNVPVAPLCAYPLLTPFTLRLKSLHSLRLAPEGRVIGITIDTAMRAGIVPANILAADTAACRPLSSILAAAVNRCKIAGKQASLARYAQIV